MKDIAAYRALLDWKIETGVLTLNEQERENVERFYLDFPLGKEIVNRLGERVFLKPRPGGDVHEYIHHFAVKRGRRADGSYWENYSETHLALFGEIEKTVAEFDDRLIGGTDIKDTEGKIIGVSPRLYFVRDIGKNHLVTVSVEPQTMLLTWTHMLPRNRYVAEIRQQERNYVEQYGVIDEEGKKITLYVEYERVKRLKPLYLATALGQQNPSHQAADSVATDSIAQSGKKIKGIAPGKQQEEKKMNEHQAGERVRLTETARWSNFLAPGNVEKRELPPGTVVTLNSRRPEGYMATVEKGHCRETFFLFNKYLATAETVRPDRVMRVGIFNARLVGFGDRYGKEEGIKYEETAPMLEFYDARQDKDKFGRFGQFVSRYDLGHMRQQSSFFAFGGLLALDGGIPEWTVSGDDMRNVIAWAGTQLTEEEKQALAPKNDQQNEQVHNMGM